MWGESVGHNWITLTKANYAELRCFRWYPLTHYWTNSWVAGDLKFHDTHVMSSYCKMVKPREACQFRDHFLKNFLVLFMNFIICKSGISYISTILSLSGKSNKLMSVCLTHESAVTFMFTRPVVISISMTPRLTAAENRAFDSGSTNEEGAYHDDVIKWKHFPRYWPFVRGIHRSPVNSPHKGQRRRALMFSLICARINGWVNNGEAGDLRLYRAHYDVTVIDIMLFGCQTIMISIT